MTPLPKELEALMPEPVAWTLNQELQQRETTCKAHMWFVDPQNTSWAPLFTADQMREAIKAATERERERALTICAELREHYSDFKDTALLNGDVELSNAASGEPRACEAIATAIRGGGREG